MNVFAVHEIPLVEDLAAECCAPQKHTGAAHPTDLRVGSRFELQKQRLGQNHVRQQAIHEKEMAQQIEAARGGAGSPALQREVRIQEPATKCCGIRVCFHDVQHAVDSVVVYHHIRIN